MGNRRAVLALGTLFLSMALGSTSQAKADDIVVGNDLIQEENMSLIQEGDFVVPEIDYSFEEEDIISYLEAGRPEDTELQLAAQNARQNDNETLNERKTACAQALYSAMVNYQESVSVAEYALTKNEFKEVISDLVNSNPELFYIGQKRQRTRKSWKK